MDCYKGKQLFIASMLFIFVCYASNTFAAKPAGAQNAFYHYNLAWSALLAKDYGTASEQFSASRGQLPNNLRWMAADGQAWIAFYQGRYDEAKTAFQSIVAKNKYAYLSYKGLGFIALHNNDGKRAINLIMKSFHIYKYQPVWSYTWAADAFREKFLFWSADKVLDLAERTYPQSGEVYLARARLLLAIDKKDRAYDALIAASYYAPFATEQFLQTITVQDTRKYNAALFNIAWGYFYLGKYEQALNVFDRILKTAPYDLATIRGKAYSLMRLESFKAAEYLLNYCVRHGSTEKLPAVRETYITPQGKHVPIYTNAKTMLGWVYFHFEEYDHAALVFGQQVNAHPNWINARLGLSHAQYRLYHFDLAANNLHRVNTVAPGYGVPLKPEIAEGFLFADYTFGNYSTGAAVLDDSEIIFGGGHRFNNGAYAGAFAEYNRAYFRAPTPKNNIRIAYDFLFPLTHKFLWVPAIDLKGNYFGKRSTPDAADKLMPYMGLLIYNQLGTKFIDVGYARERYRGRPQAKDDQLTLGYGAYTPNQYWFYQGRVYIVHDRTIQSVNTFQSLQLLLTHYFNPRYSLSVNALLGKRVHGYDLLINNSYETNDVQHGSMGISYNFETVAGTKWKMVGSYERYQLPQGGSPYHVYYITLGVRV